MRILVFCCKGFETMELSPFVDVMGWARADFNADIDVDLCGFTREVKSTFGVLIRVDRLIDEIDLADYDALAIPGGFEEYGFYKEAYDERFSELIRSFNAAGKVIASICVGALPIGKSGVLSGRRGTTYHLSGGHRQQELKNFGVNVINERIVVDDNIITSYCPETAVYVAFELLKKLKGAELTGNVMHNMGY